jgi:colanic acid/amylovoran biosynthesis glycosyltransferase
MGPIEKVAYVIGRYPAVSHTFVTREVQALRAAGVEVKTISIHRASEADALSALDRAEREATYSLLPPRFRVLARSQLQALCSPRAYIKTLAAALSGEPRGVKARLWRVFYFAEAIMVWEFCRREGISHIHAHHLNQASDAAMLAADYGNAASGDSTWTWSFTMHGPNEFYDVTRFRLAEKAQAATFVACISDFARSQVMGFVPEERWPRLRIVHCGVDPDEYDPRSLEAAGPDDSEFHILYVGRLVPFKGQGLLLEALAELRARGIEATLTLIGEGPSREELEKKALRLGVDGAARFAGAVGQDEIRSYFAAADAFCLPSFAEGVPVVLMEAMAMELPVVTTRVMGIPELVDDGADGILVRPGRLDALTSALTKLAADPGLREELGSRAREKVRAEFDVRQAGREMASILAGDPQSVSEIHTLRTCSSPSRP